MKRYVRVLPSPAKVTQIKALLARGFSHDDIVAKVWTEDPGYHGRKAVRAVEVDPHGFDTDVDHIAVARALQGDRAVWDSLTHYERRAVMIAVHDRHQAERAENAEDRGGFTGPQWDKRKGWQYVAPNDRIPGWMENVADMIGWTGFRLGQEAKDFAAARVL